MGSTFKIRDGKFYINDRHIKGELISKDNKDLHYPVYVRQLKVPFGNGYVLSIIWGTGSMTYRNDSLLNDPIDVEIAIMKHGRWVLPDQVQGHCSPDYVAGVIRVLESL